MTVEKGAVRAAIGSIGRRRRAHRAKAGSHRAEVLSAVVEVEAMAPMNSTPAGRGGVEPPGPPRSPTVGSMWTSRATRTTTARRGYFDVSRVASIVASDPRKMEEMQAMLDRDRVKQGLVGAGSADAPAEEEDDDDSMDDESVAGSVRPAGKEKTSQEIIEEKLATASGSPTALAPSQQASGAADAGEGHGSEGGESKRARTVSGEDIPPSSAGGWFSPAGSVSSQTAKSLPVIKTCLLYTSPSPRD